MHMFKTPKHALQKQNNQEQRGSKVIKEENVNGFEEDASKRGYGGILKQIDENDTKEQIVRFHSGSWITTQQNYSTIMREILSIILCVSKFQNDLFNQKYLIRVDCKSTKEVLQKDIQNLVSKQSFTRWQAILSVFDFDIEYNKGETNSIPD